MSDVIYSLVAPGFEARHDAYMKAISEWPEEVRAVSTLEQRIAGRFFQIHGEYDPFSINVVGFARVALRVPFLEDGTDIGDVL